MAKAVVTFELQAIAGVAHTRVLVFAATGGEHLALCGSLILRPEQWQEFRRQLTRGPLNPRRHFVLQERTVAEEHTLAPDSQGQPRKRDAFEVARETLLKRYGTTDPERLRRLGADEVEIGAAEQIVRREAATSE